ncbi:hypothetical protein V6N11_055400 [Hibiscus sabdariffa]|uniref:cysteine-S-conjugate beta-lyase n=1 Tax=Hibiscus sabdariffa TaxID=183260 RepID=A0ABR2PF62_9ROSI
MRRNKGCCIGSNWSRRDLGEDEIGDVAQMVERSLSMREDSLLLDFPRSFLVKKELTLEGRLQLSAAQFSVNCLGQWNMDASASVTPDYITATENGPYDYTRSGNPTLLAKLERADRAFCFTSGMAALSAVANLVGSDDRSLSTLSEFLAAATLQQRKTGPYDYTRSGNPTRDTLERLLAMLEKAYRAFCFTSGMAALSVVANLVGSGQEIVAGDDIYGGSDRLLSRVTPKSGVLVKRVNTSDLDEVAAVIGPKTKLVCFVGPQLQMDTFNLTFFRNAFCLRISEIAHANGALVLVDNSIMSPVLSRWLELGADIVMHSATKFIAGHSDVMAGVLAVKEESLAKELYFLQNAVGSGLPPFDCWICLRGIKTMALRVEKQQENAQKIAEFLSSHPRVKKVNYAGLPGHPGRDLHYSQVLEDGCILSAVRDARGLTEDLVRISVGIEDVSDLIADLDDALRTGPSVVAAS